MLYIFLSQPQQFQLDNKDNQQKNKLLTFINKLD